MNIIFGFGEPDKQASLQLKSDLSNFLKQKLELVDFDSIMSNLVHDLCNEFQSLQSKTKFNDNEYNACWINYPTLAKEYHSIIGIIEGKYNAYNTNHPMSPDGFACLSFPFNFTFLVRKEPNQDESKDSCLYEERVEVFSN